LDCNQKREYGKHLERGGGVLTKETRRSGPKKNILEEMTNPPIGAYTLQNIEGGRLKEGRKHDEQQEKESGGKCIKPERWGGSDPKNQI